MLITSLCLVALFLSVFPMLLFLDNLRHYLPPGPGRGEGIPPVSVLIPARNEEALIGSSLSAVLANGDVDLEVIVLDDHSTDATAAIVREFAARDPRVQLREAPALPDGWCGKQHACNVLGNLATKPYLVFIDADVQLAPDSLVKMAAFMQETGADLGSGFPRQITVGFLEQLLIPLIHFILLGFLPLRRMRISDEPSLSAGCGQLFIVKKSAYESMGGHAVIRTSLHDGIKLPRAFRKAKLKTDLFDATGLATCRMYRSASEVWLGLAKNAGEALAAPGMIVPATLLLIGGQVLPVLLLLLAKPLNLSPLQVALAALATLALYLPRYLGIKRFRQTLLGAVFHPVGVVLLLMIQWYAFFRSRLGRPSVWKGRPYPSG